MTGFLLLEEDSLRLLRIKERSGGFSIEGEEGLDGADHLQTSAFDSFYLSLPLRHLDFRLLRMPFSSREKLRETIPYELQGLVVSVDEIVFDPLVISEEENSFVVLVPYMKKERLRGIMEPLRARGIDPEVVTSLELARVRKEFSTEALTGGVKLSEEEIRALVLEELEGPTINLRQDDLSFTRHSQEKERLLRRLSRLTALALLLVSLGLLLQWLGYRKEAATTAASMQALYRDAFGEGTRVVDPLYQLRANIKQLREELEGIRGVRALDMLSLFSERWVDGVVLEELTVNPGLVLLKGEAGSLKDVQSLISSLKKGFRGVELAESRKTVSGRLAFSITAEGPER